MLCNYKNNKANNANISEAKPSTFHDFLCNKAQEKSAISDLGSERHVHLEGIPFYGSRGDITGPESSNRFTGYKRSNSDSFMMSSRDKFPQVQADSHDNPLLRKLLKYPGGERARRPYDDEASFISRTRIDANGSKLDRAIPVGLGPGLQYPPRMSQVMPFGHQVSMRSKDTNVGPSVISQMAADEGSRTGIKESGILSLINALSTPSQLGTESGGGQMTIFYGGQAHVFDNVNPNKADVIMALAGSNGGSWCTNYKPNSVIRPPTGENRVAIGENDNKREPNRGFISGHQPTRGSELSTRHNERSGQLSKREI